MIIAHIAEVCKNMVRTGFLSQKDTRLLRVCKNDLRVAVLFKFRWNESLPTMGNAAAAAVTSAIPMDDVAAAAATAIDTIGTDGPGAAQRSAREPDERITLPIFPALSLIAKELVECGDRGAQRFNVRHHAIRQKGADRRSDDGRADGHAEGRADSRADRSANNGHADLDQASDEVKHVVYRQCTFIRVYRFPDLV